MALAQRVGGTLWTVDYRFRDAAEKVGIVVEPG